MPKTKNLIGSNFRRNVVYGYCSQGLKIVFGFAWVTIITKTAGIEVYGMIALLVSFSGVITNLLTFRTNEAVVKFYKRGELEHAPGLCRLAISAGIVIDLGVACLAWLLIQLLATKIAATFLKAPELANEVAMYSWVIFAVFLRGTGIGLLSATEKFRTIYTLAAIEQMLKVGLVLVILQYEFALSIGVIVIIILCPTVLVTLIFLLQPLRELFGDLKGEPISEKEIRSYIQFSLSTFVSSALKAGNRNIDTLILGFLTSPASVGIYSLFKQFLSPLGLMVGPFYEQIYPRFVHAMSDNDSASMRHTISTTNLMLFKWTFVLLFAVILVAASYWSYMGLVFSKEYMITFFLMAASSLILQRLWWSRAFALAHDPNTSIVANIFSTILTVTMVFAGVQMFGLIGAAIGVLVSTVFINCFWQYILRKYTNRTE